MLMMIFVLLPSGRVMVKRMSRFSASISLARVSFDVRQLTSSFVIPQSGVDYVDFITIPVELIDACTCVIKNFRRN